MDNIKEGLQDVVKLASTGRICLQAVCKDLMEIFVLTWLLQKGVIDKAAAKHSVFSHKFTLAGPPSPLYPELFEVLRLLDKMLICPKT